MSDKPLRRPSTLAADKFRATTSPLGWAPPPKPSARPDGAPVTGAARALSQLGGLGYSKPANGVSARPSTLPAAASRQPAPVPAQAPSGPARATAQRTGKPTVAPRANAKAATLGRERRDGILVTSIVVAFVFLTVAIASMRVTGSMKTNRSRIAVEGTLVKVYEQQAAFRTINRRFASWNELAARGAKLPSNQVLVESRASASHWFVSVRDSATGVLCSRTGELFDDSPSDRLPSCSAPARR